MVVQPIKSNFEQTKSQPTLKQKKVVKPYLEAKQLITTNNNIKPLPGEGHLIYDNPISKVKYFFKDMAYSLKSLKNGYNGTANDHQLGNLNDVGLKIGGLGIATYLASQTTNPKAKLMEFVGLGAFLASMSIFPKIAISKPARIMHGFDIDKQYIDDQGRKKSVFQDSNYIPYDLYRGERKSEDLDIIGDRMGIPRDAVNRHEIIKEQMRKIATQNNTLWMLTAGLATPALAGLTCCALDQPISSGVAKYRNAKYNGLINDVLQKTLEMNSELSTLKENSLSKDIVKILTRYKKEGIIPQEELEHITKLLTSGLDYKTSDNLAKEILNIFETSANTAEHLTILNNENIENALKATRKGIKLNKQPLDKYIMPTTEEFRAAVRQVLPEADFSKDMTVKNSDIQKIKTALNNIIDQKIATADPAHKNFLTSIKTTFLTGLEGNIKTQRALVVNDIVIDNINKLSMIIGEFKANQSIIDKCMNFKFAYAPETIIANYSGKFERTLLNELNFTQEELKLARNSADYAKEILDKRLNEIAKDEIRYNRIVRNLVNVISEMETALHGGADSESVIKNLIEAIENNANTTAKRLNKLNGFSGTIKSLVNGDVNNLTNEFKSEESFRNLLDGVLPDLRNGDIKKEINGIGSFKNLQIANITERYQGNTSSFFRVIEALDIYKRAINPENFAPEHAMKQNSAQYIDDLIRVVKDTILDANCAKHINKLHTINNGEFYRDIINAMYKVEFLPGDPTPRGVLTKATEEAAGDNKLAKEVIARLKRYIGRLHDIVPNNDYDYTKRNHKINPDRLKWYEKTSLTDKSLFEAIGQEITELFKGAADRRYGTRKWLGIIGGITSAVFAVTFLAQLGFGKLSNPEKMKQQVTNNEN